MKSFREITRKQLFLRMVTNPIFIAVYWLSFYELYTLCRFGRMNNNVNILLISMMFFLIYLIILLIRILKKPITGRVGILNKNKACRIAYTCTALVVITFVTVFYGFKIYQSSINFNGKLSWVLKDLKDKKTVKLQHNNIYESGIEGILEDIDKKIPMVKKLYITNDFQLKFNADGAITSFDTFLYGKNDKGKLKSYLISYNRSKSDKITIYLHGYTNGKFNEDKLLEPLINTMKVLPLKDTVNKWKENQYGILYYGKRSFGYNTSGIVYINSQGETKNLESAPSEIIGYAVSLYVPGKESTITPQRYILADDLNNIKQDSLSTENENPAAEGENTATEDGNTTEKQNNISKKSNGTDEFYLSEQIGYRLEVTAAAAGSRAYALTKTLDGGASWKVINEDPFTGHIGVAAGITFTDDNLGFIGLSKSGGSYGELYRTEDGGKSYKKVTIPEIKVTLKGSETYNPFDLPEMPYRENGIFNMLVGQGADGDYNGNSKALYESKDNGKTWAYVKEVK